MLTSRHHDLIVPALIHHETTADLLAHAVLQARNEGASWTDVGEALGTSRQAAHERFAKQVALHRDSKVPECFVCRLNRPPSPVPNKSDTKSRKGTAR